MMHPILRTRATLAAVLLLAAAPLAHAADPVGHYTVEGKSPDGGKMYHGVVDVTKTGDTYQVVWHIGGDTSVGTAIGNEQFLAVSYTSGNSTGLALYGQQGDNWLGPWTYAGSTALGAERWVRK